MQGKYQSRARYIAARLQRGCLRLLLRQLISWRKLSAPKRGYTVIIGCNWRLAAMVGADLKMLENQNRENLDQIILVFDRPREWIEYPVEESLRARFPQLPLHFVYYNAMQARFLDLIGWGWAYAWLSWALGIAETRTQYALLQDFDAILLRENILEERYQAIQQRGDQYVGTSWYQGCGVEMEDRVVRTPEMMFDAAFVRENFRPIDLFNHVCVHNGRSVDFDTFLYAQATAGRRSTLPIDEEDMVHPSQMICQFTHLMSGRGTMSAERSNLLMIPYFMYLGGEEEYLAKQLEELSKSDGQTTSLLGKTVHISALTSAHVDWLGKQIIRLEKSFAGDLREPVRKYLEQIAKLRGHKIKQLDEFPIGSGASEVS